MHIGEFAERAGLPRPTIRYYEQRGLLPEPARSAAGYRRYGEEDVLRVRFIRRAQELGFTLRQIRELLTLHGDPGAAAADVKALAERKLGEIERKIRDLQRMQAALQPLAEACDGEGSTHTCPILHALEGAPE